MYFRQVRGQTVPFADVRLLPKAEAVKRLLLRRHQRRASGHSARARWREQLMPRQIGPGVLYSGARPDVGVPMSSEARPCQLLAQTLDSGAGSLF